MENKKLLLVSLAANAGLTAWIALRSLPTAPLSAGSTSLETMVHAAPPAWTDVQSDDYPTYIRNLANIGCPERTIRAIIQADLDDSFAARRAPILEKLALSNTSEKNRRNGEAALQELDLEKQQLIEQLFGTRPHREEPGPQTATADPAPGVSRRTTQSVATDAAPTMPLVFRPVDTNQVSLNADELAVIDRVRETFLNELGTNQDISSLDYLQRWQKGQQQADNLLDALLGRQEWLRYQQAAQGSESPVQ